MSVAIDGFWRRARHTPIGAALRGRFDGQLDWRRRLAEAGLAEEPVRCVEQVVARSRLWMVERVEVAEELIAHFQDAQAAGVSPGQAVADFGDARQAARLIRRAKRAGRPLVWHAWWWATRGLLVLGVLYVAYAMALLTGRPIVSTDYVAEVNESVNRSPATSHAWPIYSAALQEIEESLGPMTAAEKLRAQGRYVAPLVRLWRRLPGNEGSGDGFDAWLQQNRAIIDKLHEAAAKPTLGLGVGPAQSFTPNACRLLGLGDPDQAVDPDDLWNGSLMNAMYPHQELRTVGQLVSLDGEAAVDERDASRAVASIRAIHGIADQAGEPPLHICMLIGSAVRRMADRLVARVLQEAPGLFDDAQLRDLAHLISKPTREPLHYLEGERAVFFDILQRSYTESGPGGGRLSAEGIATFGEEMDLDDSTVYAIRPLMRGGGQPGVLSSVSTHALAMLRMPVAAHSARTRHDECVAAGQRMRQAHDALQTPLWRHPRYASDERDARPGLLQMLSPSDRWMAERWHREEARREALLIAIALELHRREHDAWPGSLEELSPRWLPELPVDRINGGPLGYRVIDEQPVVYSLGIDGDDDGSRIPPAMDEEHAKAEGMTAFHEYRIGPPLTAEERRSPRKHDFRRDPTMSDGDWIIWPPDYVRSAKD